MRFGTTRGVSSVCAHVPVRSGGCRSGGRGWCGDAPLRRHLVPGSRKPSWTPPSQAFGPVWTVLYAQMAYSAQRVARTSDPRRRRALALWWLQLGLNAAWTPIFLAPAEPAPPRSSSAHSCPPSRPPPPRARASTVRRGCSTRRTSPGRRMRRRSTSRSGGGTAPRRPSRAWADPDRNRPRGMDDNGFAATPCWLWSTRRRPP